MRRLHGPLPL
ncbi:uncharacterized, partial [Tachysurus ichikawai]